MASKTQGGVSVEQLNLAGGLDVVSPALILAPGALIGASNYEPDLGGGYKRMFGIERLDGHTAPSKANYYLMSVALSGAVIAGNTVTGVTSGATAVVLQVNGTTELAVCVTSGTFVAETLTVSAVNVGTVSTVGKNSAATPVQHAWYASLAANYYRTMIAAVPGSGPIRGVWYYGGHPCVFRDNVGATALGMYKATASGWSQITFGRQLQFSARKGTVTITIAAPGVVSFTAHAAVAGTGVAFSTTGALPTGITAGTVYYVLAPGANTFTIAATPGGAAITTTGSQSGTHTATFVGATISDGDTVTGATSGAYAVVARSLLRFGAWTSDPIGSLVFDTVTAGPFTVGEALLVGGAVTVQPTVADTAITLAPGGRHQFVNYNFSGGVTTQRMFFTDGKNPLCEFDGTRVVPIYTGSTPDTPTFLTAWKNMLVTSIGTNVLGSSIGQPYYYDTALGSAFAEALGGVCTGLKPQIGTATAGTLTIFAQGPDGGYMTYNLYGTSVLDFNLVTQSPESGAVPYSAQNIGFAYYLDTKGVQQVNTSQVFGGFIMAAITRAVQPIIDAARGKLTASCVVKRSNQYRIFFNDGTGLLIFMQPKNAASVGGTVLLGDEVGAIMSFDHTGMGSGWYLNTVESVTSSTGVERIFGGGSDGFVYELDVGTSLDGNPFPSALILPFNSSKTARNIKHYKRAVLQVKCQGTANVSIGYDLDYASKNTEPGVFVAGALPGQGGIWDAFTWDSFTWDLPAISQIEIDTPGDATNIAFAIYGKTDQDLPYTIQNIVSQYVVRRQAR